MARRNSIHLCRQDRILNVFLYVFLAIFLILCAYPVYFVLIASFSSIRSILGLKPAEVLHGR